MKEGVARLEALVKIKPFDVKVLLNFNTLLMQERSLRHDLIKENFSKIFQIEPDHEKALFNKAIYLTKQVLPLPSPQKSEKELQEALAIFEKIRGQRNSPLRLLASINLVEHY